MKIKPLLTCALLALPLSAKALTFADIKQQLGSLQQRLFGAANPSEPEYLPKKTAPLLQKTGRVESPAQGLSFTEEIPGSAPSSLTPVVGHWLIGREGENTFLVVDGRGWSQGQPAAGVADKARALYGERYAEFLDSVKAYAYFPYAVINDVANFREGTLRFRFKGVAGRIDQGAGLLFDLKPNGDYYSVRANPLENNLVLWRFQHGVRSSVAWIRNTPTPSNQWHELKLEIRGRIVKAWLNNTLYLTHELPEPVSGRVGLWSKADSVVYFDDIRVNAH